MDTVESAAAPGTNEAQSSATLASDRQVDDSQQDLDRRVARLNRRLDDVHKSVLEVKFELRALEAEFAKSMTETAIWIVVALGVLALVLRVFS